MTMRPGTTGAVRSEAALSHSHQNRQTSQCGSGIQRIDGNVSAGAVEGMVCAWWKKMVQTRLAFRLFDRRQVAFLLLPFLASGCAMIPPEPIVTGPLTAVPPVAYHVQAEPNGSIYQPTAYGNYPLFEDRRPRNVGDIVTVVIQEKTNAAKNVSTTTNRTGSASLNFAPAPAFLPNSLGDRQNFEVEGGNNADGKGSTRADNTFTGTLTTTVVGVLPNGNLQIAGDKQMAINRGSEHVRFSGVVDPRSITGANTVLSTQVADARIEFRSKGVMDEVQTMGWLQRFFLNISPF